MFKTILIATAMTVASFAASADINGNINDRVSKILIESSKGLNAGAEKSSGVYAGNFFVIINDVLHQWSLKDLKRDAFNMGGIEKTSIISIVKSDILKSILTVKNDDTVEMLTVKKAAIIESFIANPGPSFATEYAAIQADLAAALHVSNRLKGEIGKAVSNEDLLAMVTSSVKKTASNYQSYVSNTGTNYNVDTSRAEAAASAEVTGVSTIGILATVAGTDLDGVPQTYAATIAAIEASLGFTANELGYALEEAYDTGYDDGYADGYRDGFSAGVASVQ